MKRVLFFILSIWLLASCQMKEEPIEVPQLPDSVSIQKVVMGPDYNNQVFVNLNSGVIKTIDNRSWDLCLDASSKGFLISMNGGTGVQIAETQDTSFQYHIEWNEIKWQWDGASGIPDSLVLKNWCDPITQKSHQKVYLINRGLGPNEPNNFFQFKISEVAEFSYTIVFTDAHGNNKKEITVGKDPGKLHVYFSFDDGGKALNFEPPKTNWHLCFLQYRWVYYEFTPPLLYQVSGVFINTSNVFAAVDSTLNFYDIQLSHAQNRLYKNTRDAIGYDWKVPFFKPTGVDYRTRDYVNYFVRVQNLGTAALIYKLRFINFYDNQGVKGTPTYELKRLQ